MEDEVKLDPKFPSKPVIDPAKEAISRSILSLVIFVYFYYTFVSKDWFFIVALVGVLLIHELGHFIAMKAFGYVDVRMFFVPMIGAFVSGNKDRISQRQRTIILLAGPAPGIIIGIVLFYIFKGQHNPDMIVVSFLFMFINVLNLFPIIPLDGGRLIQALFFNKGGVILNFFTLLSAGLMIYFAIHFKSYFILIIPFGLLIGIISNAKLSRIRKMLDDKDIDYNKPYDQLTDKEYWQIRQRIVRNYNLYQSIDPLKFEESKMESRIIKQVKALRINKPTADMSIGLKFGIIIFWVGLIVAPFIVTPILTILNRI